MNLPLVPLRHPGRVRGAARVLVGLAVAAALSGCVAPWRMVEVREPLTAHPIVATIPPAANGAIFQQASYEPLFQDRRARRVGDTLTVQINEKLFASKKAATTATRTGNSSLSIPEIKGWPGVSVKGATVKGESNNEFEGKGASGSDNTFTGFGSGVYGQVCNGTNVDSDLNTFTGNTFVNNRAGINFYVAGACGATTVNAAISGNSFDGGLWSGATVVDVPKIGVRWTGAARPNDLDAKCNWWGSADGPGAPGASTVTPGVDFSPWNLASSER